MTIAGRPIAFFLEHPEDLGTVIRKEDRRRFRPASIWQLPELRKLISQDIQGAFTVQINQCCFGTEYRKPTRLASNLPGLDHWGPTEWPSFDDEGFLTWPQLHCGCTITQSLAKANDDEGFRTTHTASYPPQLAHDIAEAIHLHLHTPPPEVGTKGGVQSEKEEEKGGSGGDIGEDTIEKKIEKLEEEVTRGEDGREEVPSRRGGFTMAEDRREEVPSSREGFMMAY